MYTTTLRLQVVKCKVPIFDCSASRPSSGFGKIYGIMATLGIKNPLCLSFFKPRARARRRLATLCERSRSFRCRRAPVVKKRATLRDHEHPSKQSPTSPRHHHPPSVCASQKYTTKQSPNQTRSLLRPAHDQLHQHSDPPNQMARWPKNVFFRRQSGKQATIPAFCLYVTLFHTRF